MVVGSFSGGGGIIYRHIQAFPRAGIYVWCIGKKKGEREETER